MRTSAGEENSRVVFITREPSKLFERKAIRFCDAVGRGMMKQWIVSGGPFHRTFTAPRENDGRTLHANVRPNVSHK